LATGMGFDRHIVRLMAVMILAIIAHVAPSAVQAHEGHVHCGHRGRMVSEAATASLPAANPGLDKASGIAELAVTLLTAPRLRVTTGKSTASVRAVDADRCCCPGPCKRRCCETTVGGTFGIFAGPASPAMPMFRAAVLIPDDVAGRAGIAPEALRKPPRTLA
jgi:hypothetical protein